MHLHRRRVPQGMEIDILQRLYFLCRGAACRQQPLFCDYPILENRQLRAAQFADCFILPAQLFVERRACGVDSFLCQALFYLPCQCRAKRNDEARANHRRGQCRQNPGARNHQCLKRGQKGFLLLLSRLCG